MPISRIPGVGLDTGSSGVAPSNLSTGAPSWDGSGNVTCLSSISVGNATPTTSGFGITFPATQSASSNANTLDDYEEGTWTPVVIGSTTAGTATHTVQVGRYTKIGRLVQIQFLVQWNSGTGTGALQISGLPFTSDSTTNNTPTTGGYSSNLALTANNIFYAAVPSNSAVVAIDQYPVGGGGATNVPYDAAATVGVSMCYNV